MSGFNPTPPKIKAAVAAYKQNTKPLANVPPRPSALQGTSKLASAPAPTITPSPAPLPFDPVYEQTVSNNGQRLTDTLGGIQQSRNTAVTDAGYVESGGAFQLDPNNPFSRAALLQRHYDQSVKGSTNGLAAQGQLYSGALQNAQNENRFQFDQGNNANLRSLQDQLAALAERRTGAIADTADANTSALGTSITSAQSQANTDRGLDAEDAKNALLGEQLAAAKKPAFTVEKDKKGRTVHVYPDGRRVTLK